MTMNLLNGLFLLGVNQVYSVDDLFDLFLMVIEHPMILIIAIAIVSPMFIKAFKANKEFDPTEYNRYSSRFKAIKGDFWRTQMEEHYRTEEERKDKSEARRLSMLLPFTYLVAIFVSLYFLYVCVFNLTYSWFDEPWSVLLGLVSYPLVFFVSLAAVNIALGLVIAIITTIINHIRGWRRKYYSAVKIRKAEDDYEK